MDITFDIPADWDLGHIATQLSARFPEYQITPLYDLRKMTISSDMPIAAAVLPWIEGAMWGLSQHR
jgi:hypothetical protein